MGTTRTTTTAVRTAVVGVAVAALLAACGGTGDGPTGSTGSTPLGPVGTVPTPADGTRVTEGAATGGTTTAEPTTAEVSGTAAPAEASPADPADEGDGGEGLDAAPTGSTDPVEAEPVGGPVLFTAVRVAAQDGFDRVVLEYEGDGVPGYRFSYATETTQQASGLPVDLPGATGLSGIVRGIDWTSDDNYSGPSRLSAPGTVSVTQVDVGVLFEGDQDPYIGVTEEKPFRVTVLEDPTRIVVDVAH